MEAVKTDFLKLVFERYKTHCNSKEKEPSAEDFLQYLVNKNFITDKTMKRFVVVSAYPETLDNLGIKQNAIWEIEMKYDISESTIKRYIARFMTFFR